MIDIRNLTTTGAWRLEDEGEGIGFLAFDLPGEKVNKLTLRVVEDLERILDTLAKDPDLRALVVWNGKFDSGTFIAGADIREIRAVSDPAEATRLARRGQLALGRFSKMPLVTAAAIHGNCLGGGTELALACDFRLASLSPSTKIGLPEVQLGILPGFGGTQRLPRLIGVTRALPLILTGKTLDAKAAARAGIVDEVVYPALLRARARAFALEALAAGGKAYRPRRRKPVPRSERLMLSVGPLRNWIRSKARKDIESRVGLDYPAPFRALDAVIDGSATSLEEGLEIEARLVGELIASPISKNLMDLFLASEELRRGRRDEKETADVPKRPEKQLSSAAALHSDPVGVLGAGVMGGAIAALLAQNGYRVRLRDIALEPLQAALKKVREIYASLEKKRRRSRREVVNDMAAITATTGMDGFERCGLVIEAVVEDMEVKRRVLGEIEGKVSPDTLLASNTSSLLITELQSSLTRPERVLGLHFFNPVHRMPLVEVVRGSRTSDEALERGEAFARKLGKLPLRVEDGPGFVVNRILTPYLNEAVRLFEEGASPPRVDEALRAFGMPMGPFELLDEVGLDVAAKVSRVLHEALGARVEPPQTISTLLSLPGVRGKKTGKGFYLHDSEGRKESKGGGRRRPNLEVLALGGTSSTSVGSAPTAEEREAWTARLLYPMINEAAFVLEDRIVERPSQVDAAMVLGTGFPPFRGGPLRYADTVGLRKIMSFLGGSGNARWKPCELLVRLAEEGSSFHALERVKVPAGAGA